MRHLRILPLVGWMLQLSSATGRFSVGLGATRLDDLCKVPDQGE